MSIQYIAGTRGYCFCAGNHLIIHVGIKECDGYMPVMRDDLGFSLEFGMKQLHGNIPETRWTRRISFGFGWESRELHPAGPRAWLHGHRVKHEPENRRLAWSFYWSRHKGLSFTNYLNRDLAMAEAGR